MIGKTDFEGLGIKALVSDFDETLSEPYGVLPDDLARELIEAIASAHLTLIIVSGRPLDFLSTKAEKLGCSDYVAENGNIVVSKECGVRILSSGAEITPLFDPVVYEVKQTIVEFPQKLEGEAFQILEDAGVDYCIERNNGRTMVMPPDTSKINGLRVLLDDLGIKLDEVIAFGDGENDISFMREAKVSVAVANAHQGVKDVADYVSGKPYGGGVLEFLMGCVL